MKLEIILSIIGLLVAISGFNVAKALNSFIQGRIDLVKELNSIRQGCKEETNRLESHTRQKFNKVGKAINHIGSHQQKLTESHNELAQSVFQIKSFLEANHQFIEKQNSPDLVGQLNPFDSLDIDISPTQEGD